jgi:Tol biopolymer transport system component
MEGTMKTRLRATFVSAALVATVGIAGAHGAIQGEVILASNTTVGKAAVMSAVDGSGLALVECSGNVGTDVTHGGSPRFFLQSQRVVGVTQFLGWDEDCSSGVQLTSDTSIDRGLSRWSRDGTRVAYAGTRVVGGVTVERGIFVGDVTLDVSGRPIAITNERLAIPLAADASFPSWAGDNRRVTFALPVASQSDVFVGDVDAGTATNVTSSSMSEFQPSFSPVTDRIAFVRKTSKRGAWRNDVFVLDLSSGRTTQVTSKSNANVLQIGHPDWSPGGSGIAFSGLEASLTATPDIYRIPSDGSAKATLLTGASSDIYYAPLWRR